MRSIEYQAEIYWISRWASLINKYSQCHAHKVSNYGAHSVNMDWQNSLYAIDIPNVHGGTPHGYPNHRVVIPGNWWEVHDCFSIYCLTCRIFVLKHLKIVNLVTYSIMTLFVIIIQPIMFFSCSFLLNHIDHW